MPLFTRASAKYNAGFFALSFCACLHGETPRPDPAALLKKTAAVLDHFDEMRAAYTYRRTERIKDFDSSGAVRADHSTVVEVLYLAEKPYDHLLMRDGKPLAGSDARSEQAKFERTAHEAEKLSARELADRRAKANSERKQQNEFWQYIPQADHVTLLPDVVIAGRPAYVVQLTPKPDYRGKYANILRNARATISIDQKDFMLIRLDTDVLGDISFGFFLARLDKGSRIHFEMTRINDEVWLPRTFQTYGSGRAFFKTIRRQEEMSYSAYQKYRTDSKMKLEPLAPAK